MRRALFGPASEESRDLVAASDELDTLLPIHVLVAVGDPSTTVIPEMLLDLLVPSAGRICRRSRCPQMS